MTEKKYQFLKSRKIKTIYRFAHKAMNAEYKAVLGFKPSEGFQTDLTPHGIKGQ